MTGPTPNLVADPSALEVSKLQREQRRERRRLRGLEDEAQNAIAKDRAIATRAGELSDGSYRKINKRGVQQVGMSPAAALAQATREAQAPAPTSPATGFQGTGMNGKPGFQLRTEEERRARIAQSPVGGSARPLSSLMVNQGGQSASPAGPLPSFQGPPKALRNKPAPTSTPAAPAVTPVSPSPTAAPPVTPAPPVKASPGGTSGEPTFTNLPPDPFTTPYSSARIAGTTPAEAKAFTATPQLMPISRPVSVAAPTPAARPGTASPGEVFQKATARPKVSNGAPGFADIVNGAKAKPLSSLGKDDMTMRRPTGVSAARG